MGFATFWLRCEAVKCGLKVVWPMWVAAMAVISRNELHNALEAGNG